MAYYLEEIIPGDDTGGCYPGMLFYSTVRRPGLYTYYPDKAQHTHPGLGYWNGLVFL